MAGRLRANVRLALRTVRLSKWRSLLTLTGVVIGVAAFIVVVAIGEGIKNQVSGQIDQLGKNLITIRAGQLNLDASPLNIINGISNSGTLGSGDVQTVADTRGVELAAPLSLVASPARRDSGSYKAGPVIATNDNLAGIIQQKLAYGTFFDGNDSVSSAVIGAGTAQKFFGEDVPLGKSFSLLGQQFVVTGVFKQFDVAPLSLSANFNNAIFVRYQAVSQLTRSHAPIYEILVKPKDPKQVASTVANITHNLTAAHGQRDFTVLTQAESLKATNNILDLLTKMIAGVAAIALLVGGVGIMDVMLVSVTERMSEIGLRKAVGASNRQILKQFMTEALVLSAVGAIIGTLAGLLFCYLLYLFTTLDPALSWQSIVIADVVALVVGVIFGTIPAVKAARKNPISALRNE